MLNLAPADLWIAVTVFAVTASSLIGITVGGVRSNWRTGELVGTLIVVSLILPAALVFVAAHLPPELFDFLR